jgi:transcriptional regulator with GAF, ATPase, and Fis domain
MENIHQNDSSEIVPRLEISVAVNNRLEALKTLSNSISGQIAALQREEKVVVRTNIDLAEEVNRYEADLIRCALYRTGGRQRQAARLLNVKVSTLNAKIRRFGISEENFFVG